MANLYIGDKVRYVAPNGKHSINAGTIVEIDANNRRAIYRVLWSTHGNNFLYRRNELVLVHSKKRGELFCVWN